MKVISGHVRELLGITDPLWSRSIVLPPRDLRGLYLEEKSRTGQWANSLTYTQFLKDGNNCHSPASFPEFKQR
ncbi:hypothetical protein SKAU_G00191760 [Synaphobranchus kaupii]|uniref:Uncharacterized protein n=1 Tax=Synaphobranchus kaupii TaxID=118154 RepID=A0A9Q1FDS9_SYNKA|nr:hypothetical protein SKAU_G00191760 [Synaphobranchus kaupii]